MKSSNFLRYLSPKPLPHERLGKWRRGEHLRSFKTLKDQVLQFIRITHPKIPLDVSSLLEALSSSSRVFQKVGILLHVGTPPEKNDLWKEIIFKNLSASSEKSNLTFKC